MQKSDGTIFSIIHFYSLWSLQDQLWNSVINGKCGLPVCARIASEAKWWKCPNPETENGLYKLYVRISQDHEANLVALKSQNNKLKKLQKIVGKLGSLLNKRDKNTDRLDISEVKDIPSTETKLWEILKLHTKMNNFCRISFLIW